MAHVVEIREASALEFLAESWRTLFLQTPQRSFYQSLEWLQTYWRHFSQGQQLRVLVVSDNGLDGIVPLVIRPEATRGGTFRVLTYPLADWGNFYSPLGPRPAATLAAALRYLRRQRRDWDLLDLRWVHPPEFDHGETAAALASAGYAANEFVWKETAVVDFHGTWESYLAGRCGKFRSNLRRAETAAATEGVTFHRYRPESGEPSATCWDYFHECVELATRSWQGDSQTGTTLSHPEVREYFRDLCGVAAAAGALDLNLLRANGRLIAFSFNLVCDGRVDGLRIGFDRELSRLSPGRLLLARSLADSFARGDQRLDLGVETMHFKQQWLTRTVAVRHYVHYPRGSLRSQLLRLKHQLTK